MLYQPIREVVLPVLDDPDFDAYQRRVEELLARAGRLEDAAGEAEAKAQLAPYGDTAGESDEDGGPAGAVAAAAERLERVTRAAVARGSA